MTTGVLDWLVHAVVCGTVLAALTAAIVWLAGRRVPLWAQGAMWTVVLLKFLLPAWPQSTWSIEGLAVSASALFQDAEVVSAAAPRSASSLREIAWLLLGSSADPAGVPAATTRSWIPLTVLIYGLGLVVVGVLRLLHTVRFRRWVGTLAQANSHTVGFVREICSRCGFRRRVNVRLADRAMSPFIVGLWRPTVVIPRALLIRPDEMEAVVLHEVAHLRRGDMWVRQLQWLAGTVLYFWPIVAWVNRRLDLVREHACDLWALHHGRLTAGAYARCLLRASHGRTRGLWASQPAAMAANPKTVERRIDMILDSPRARTVRRASWPLAGLVGLWCAVTLTSAGAEEAKTVPGPRSGR